MIRGAIGSPSARIDADNDLIALLQQTLAPTRRIEALLASRHTERATLSRADRAFLGRLLPAVAGALGSECFVARELVAHASPAIQIVLADYPSSARTIGKLLQRAAGHPVDGYIVTTAGVEHNATLWAVQAVG